MSSAQPVRKSGLSLLPATGVQATLLLVVVAGFLIRVVGLLLYVADSGDEWGNTVAPFRVLFERGNPNAFFHPSLYYYVTAAAYVALFYFVKAAQVVDGSLSMTDLFVLDQRYFVFTARGISVLSAGLIFWAVYALAKSLWRRHEGLLAAALLAVLPVHVLYSKTVRVDSLFLLLFVVAFTSIVQVLKSADRATYGKAGLLSGLAAAANYNGAILVLPLVAAHFLRTRGDGAPRQPGEEGLRRAGTPELLGALILAAGAFFVASPFVVLNPETFLPNFAFISGLSVAEHPGWEGRDFFFYVRDLARTNPYLSALIASSSLAIALFGNRTERFVLSFPVGYLLVFSFIASKDVRFILPAMPLFLVVASSLPFCLARRFHSRRVLRLLAYTLPWALYLPCVATKAVQSLPIHPHELLSRPDRPLFDWIESNVPHRSKIAIESGIVYLIDTLKEEGSFAAELRKSIVAIRPNLDQDFIGLVYIGGCNYDPAMVANGEIDYAVISKRNVPYIESHCEEFPKVCEFYRELRANGRVVFETPDEFEPTVVYDVHAESRAESNACTLSAEWNTRSEGRGCTP
jgi:hypothetical protein